LLPVCFQKYQAIANYVDKIAQVRFPFYIFEAMRKDFNVPLLPYLKKYAEKQFFAGYRAPYKIEEDTLIGKYIMSLIIDGRQVDMRGDKKIEMSERLHIHLSEAMAERSPSLRKLVPINYYLDKLFKNELITWIKSSEDCGVRPFVSSKNFLQHYSIDESEYTHDAAYKVWQRYKRQGHNQNSTVAVS